MYPIGRICRYVLYVRVLSRLNLPNGCNDPVVTLSLHCSYKPTML